jgi:hypothetical protein
MRKAESQKVSATDNRNLTEFSKQIHDIDISPDETPAFKNKNDEFREHFHVSTKHALFCSRRWLVFRYLLKARNRPSR